MNIKEYAAFTSGHLPEAIRASMGPDTSVSRKARKERARELTRRRMAEIEASRKEPERSKDKYDNRPYGEVRHESDYALQA